MKPISLYKPLGLFQKNENQNCILAPNKQNISIIGVSPQHKSIMKKGDLFIKDAFLFYKVTGTSKRHKTKCEQNAQ